MKGLPETLVHNFQFEFLERLQLIPSVRAKVSLCFYDDLLTSPKSQTSLAACVSLVFILALCCLFLLLFCFVLWLSGYQAVKRLSMRKPCKRCYSAHHRIGSNFPHRHNLVKYRQIWYQFCSSFFLFFFSGGVPLNSQIYTEICANFVIV